MNHESRRELRNRFVEMKTVVQGKCGQWVKEEDGRNNRVEMVRDVFMEKDLYE